jgi:hypothetical protein
MLSALALAAALPAMSAAPVNDPAKLAGYYRGSVRVVDSKDPVNREWRHDVVLELRASGAELVGAVQYLGGPRVELRWTASKPGSHPIELAEVGRPVLWWATPSDGRFLTGIWTGLPESPDGNFHLERDDSARWHFDPEHGAADLEFRIEKVKGKDYLLPRITRFRNPKVLSAVNRRLLERARETHCDSSETQLLEAEVGYAAQDVFSVRITEECVASPPGLPDVADLSVTFDLTTGKEVDLLSLFKEDVTDGQIAALVFAYEIEARKRPDADECLQHYTLEKLAAPTFSFSDQGLGFRPDLGTVKDCADDVWVPYPVLAPLAAPDGIFARVAAANKDASRRYRIRRPGGSPSEDAFYTPKD